MAVKGSKTANEQIEDNKRGLSSKKRRKKKSFVFYLVLFILLITVVTISSLTIFFNIKQIKVVGQTSYSNEEILAALGIKTGENMFRIDKFKAINNLETTLPYIKSAVIKRLLPETLEVVLTSTVPAAFAETGGGIILLSPEGKVLENTDKVPENLPILKGSGIVKNTVGLSAEFTEDNKDIFIQIYEIMKKYEMASTITEINIAKRHNLRFIIENRIIVYLGNNDDLDKKVQFCNYILSKQPKNEKAVVNCSDTGERKATYDALSDVEWEKRKNIE